MIQTPVRHSIRLQQPPCRQTNKVHHGKFNFIQIRRLSTILLPHKFFTYRHTRGSRLLPSNFRKFSRKLRGRDKEKGKKQKRDSTYCCLTWAVSLSVGGLLRPFPSGLLGLSQCIFRDTVIETEFDGCYENKTSLTLTLIFSHNTPIIFANLLI